jgi:hypothetical protein
MTPTQVIAKLAMMGLQPERMEEAAELLESMWAEAKAPEQARKARQRDRQKRYRDGDDHNGDATERNSASPSVAGDTHETQKEIPPIPPKEKTLTTKHTSCARGDEEGDPITEAVDAWNALAHDFGLSKVQRLTDERKAKLRARLRDCGGLTGWDTAMGKIRGSPFLTGGNGKGWRADFDFILQAKSFTKLMEGGYDERTPRKQTGSGGLAAAYEAFDERAGIGRQGTGY